MSADEPDDDPATPQPPQHRRGAFPLRPQDQAVATPYEPEAAHDEPEDDEDASDE